MVLTTESLVVASATQLASSIGGEIVILEMSEGRYFGVDAVGARVWQLVQEPVRVGDIARTLVAEYDVEPARCEADLLQLLRQMVGARLLDVRPTAD